MGVTVREKPKGSGTYWVFIAHDGKRRSKRIGDKKAARAFAQKARQKLAAEDVGWIDDTRQIPLFEQYAQQWLEHYIRPLRRETTYCRYKDILHTKVCPVIGKKALDQIRRSELRSFLFGLYEKGYSRSTIALVKDVISGPFNYAIDDELISTNPTAGLLKRMEIKRDKTIHCEPFTQDEVAFFLQVCRQRYPAWHPFFLCAFRTGMRLGELLGLCWGDIDWQGAFVTVKRSFRRGSLGRTKTGKSRRVDMSAQLIRCLRQHYTEAKRQVLMSGRDIFTEPVFCRNGKRRDQNMVRYTFNRVLKAAGLRHIRLHDIRHTYASLLLSSGVSPMYVKDQLGHSSIQMTVDVYGSWIRNTANSGIVDRLDSAPACTLSAPCAKTKPETKAISGC